MPTKDPTNLESFLRWLPLVFIGLFAGVAKYASDIQAGKLHFSVGLFFMPSACVYVCGVDWGIDLSFFRS